MGGRAGRYVFPDGVHADFGAAEHRAVFLNVSNRFNGHVLRHRKRGGGRKAPVFHLIADTDDFPELRVAVGIADLIIVVQGPSHVGRGALGQSRSSIILRISLASGSSGFCIVAGKGEGRVSDRKANRYTFPLSRRTAGQVRIRSFSCCPHRHLIDLDGEAHPVRDERPAVPVQDFPSRGLHHRGPENLLFCLAPVFLPVDDLQIDKPPPHHQHAEGAEHRDGDISFYKSFLYQAAHFLSTAGPIPWRRSTRSP